MTTTSRPPAVHSLRYEPAPGARAAPPARRRTVAAPDPYVPPASEEPTVRSAVGNTLRLAIEVLDGQRAPDQLDTRLDASPLGYWRAETARKRP
ncbi:MAG TPA: hypothetical protein VGE11_24045, partial [Pseudonocardia sp.]